MLMKRQRSHESSFQVSISMVKEFRVPSHDRLSHRDEILTSAVQAGMNEIIHYNPVLANYVWEPG